MARRERPVDPQAGPLQGFAHDLRKLRHDAGNPTYRTLAAKAGYGSSTLSQAANGLRLPSLAVTLAYVGACGGDEEEWRRRWHDLVAAHEPVDTPPEVVPEPTGSPAIPSSSGGPDELANGPRRRTLTSRVRHPLVLPAVAVVIAALVTAALTLPRRAGSESSSDTAGCAPGDTSAAAFTGRTHLYTRVRAGAELSAPVIREIPAGCEVGFSGFCLGDTVIDKTSHTPDTRWFILPGGGTVPAALIHGRPPAAVGPSACDAGLAPPTAIRLGIEPDPTGKGQFLLRATGVGVRITGYAFRDTSGADGPVWRQVRFTAAPPSFTVHWRPSVAPAPGQGVFVAAVACLGGDGPTLVVDAKSSVPGNPARFVRVTVPARELSAATRSACRYPGSG